MKSLFGGVYAILRPYGLRRLALILCIVFAQAITQFVGVAALLPFMSAASDPTTFRRSSFGLLFTAIAGNLSDKNLIIGCGLLSLAALITANLVSIVSEYSRAVYAHNLGHWLRERLMRRLLSNPYSFFLENNSSILTKKVVQDVMQFVQQIVLPTFEAMTRIAIIAALALWLLVIAPYLALCSVLFIAFYYYLVIKPFHRKAAQISDEIKAAGRATYFSVGQAFSGVKPIFASDNTEYFIQAYLRPSHDMAALLPRVVILSSVPRYAFEMLVYGIMILWVLISLAYDKSIAQTIPTIGAVVVVAYRLMPSLQIVFSQWAQIIATRQSLEEILEEFDDADLTVPTSSDQFHAAAERLPWSEKISFVNVGFQHATSSDETLKGLSFDIQKGTHVAFVGPTGSGKSTIIDLLIGLHLPTRGLITVDSQVLSVDVLKAWRRNVGYVPQEIFLLDASIAENIAFGSTRNEIDEKLLRRAAELSRSLEFIESDCPLGFDTQIGERGVRLSGGQRQRLGIARALYRKPSLLILDEATSALDNVTERAVIEQIMKADKELTVITIAHRLTTIVQCDCINFVESGRIMASGDYTTLTAIHQPFRQLSATST